MFWKSTDTLERLMTTKKVNNEEELVELLDQMSYITDLDDKIYKVVAGTEEFTQDIQKKAKVLDITTKNAICDYDKVAMRMPCVCFRGDVDCVKGING